MNPNEQRHYSSGKVKLIAVAAFFGGALIAALLFAATDSIKYKEEPKQYICHVVDGQVTCDK